MAQEALAGDTLVEAVWIEKPAPTKNDFTEDIAVSDVVKDQEIIYTTILPDPHEHNLNGEESFVKQADGDLAPPEAETVKILDNVEENGYDIPSETSNVSSIHSEELGDASILANDANESTSHAERTDDAKLSSEELNHNGSIHKSTPLEEVNGNSSPIAEVNGDDGHVGATSQNASTTDVITSSTPPAPKHHPGATSTAVKPMVPLQVIIVGAGIGGLTAAASLRQAGHDVKLFEQSRFSNEIGAAIHVGPNASRLLALLGYDPVRMRGVHCKGFTMHKSDGTVLRDFANDHVVKECKSPWYLAHRVDLHNELKRLALGPEGPGKAAEIFLESPVRTVDENEGVVTLESGETHQADLIIAADGIHSHIRESIFDPAKPKPTGTAAYRFVLDSSSVFGNLECLPMKAEDGRCRVIMGGSKRVVVYPCRDSTLLNFVCMHEAGHVDEMAEGWNSTATADDVVETFKDFSPLVVNMLKKAQNVKRWQLLERDRIPSWIKGRVCLIGDAAHPMLPHQGQGGGQAMEDGAALGPLFSLGIHRDNVLDVLKLFQQVRHSRGSKVQWLSATQYAGRESLDPAVTQKFIFQHDVTEFARHLRSSELIV